MGNLCSWCFKNEDQSGLNNDQSDAPESINSEEPSSYSSKVNERTRLLSKPGRHSATVETSTNFDFPSNGEIPPVIPPPQQPMTNQVGIENKTETETAENKMAAIVEGIILKLIDVSGAGASNVPQSHASADGTKTDNDSLKELLVKSMTSATLLSIPNVGINSIPTLLAEQPVSHDVCCYVARTAIDFSNLLANDMKIIHKEQLVVVFE